MWGQPCSDNNAAFRLFHTQPWGRRREAGKGKAYRIQLEKLHFGEWTWPSLCKWPSNPADLQNARDTAETYGWCLWPGAWGFWIHSGIPRVWASSGFGKPWSNPHTLSAPSSSQTKHKPHLCPSRQQLLRLLHIFLSSPCWVIAWLIPNIQRNVSGSLFHTRDRTVVWILES